MGEMYICTDCGCVFDADESASAREWIGEDRYESNSSGWMYYMACPECGSTEIAEAEGCDECGEYFDKDDLIHVDDVCLCKDCARDYFDAYWEKWGYAEKTDIDRAFRVIKLNMIPHASGYKNLQRVFEDTVVKRGKEIGISKDTMVKALEKLGFRKVDNEQLNFTSWERGNKE